jgi:hypothetical protein
MAGHAAKKAAKAQARTSSIYLPLIVGVNCAYIGFRCE